MIFKLIRYTYKLDTMNYECTVVLYNLKFINVFYDEANKVYVRDHFSTVQINKTLDIFINIFNTKNLNTIIRKNINLDINSYCYFDHQLSRLFVSQSYFNLSWDDKINYSYFIQEFGKNRGRSFFLIEKITDDAIIKTILSEIGVSPHNISDENLKLIFNINGYHTIKILNGYIFEQT